jgi:hypothetical protein
MAFYRAILERHRFSADRIGMSEYEVGRKYPVRRELAFPQVDRDRKSWKHIILRRRPMPQTGGRSRYWRRRIP